MEKMLFEQLHPDELKQIINTSGIAYLPLGTLEWHESHLPFGTDAFLAYSICKEACRRTGGCVIPPLFFGTDREHDINGKLLHGMDAKAGKILPGSIYFLKPDLLFQLLKSITENIAQQGFKKLIIVSGHGGTAQVETISRFHNKRSGELKIYVFHPKNWAAEADHAGKTETSLFMAIDEKSVHTERLSRPYEGIVDSDPHKASKKKGIEYFSKIVEQIVALIGKE